MSWHEVSGSIDVVSHILVCAPGSSDDSLHNGRALQISGAEHRGNRALVVVLSSSPIGGELNVAVVHHAMFMQRPRCGVTNYHGVSLGRGGVCHTLVQAVLRDSTHCRLKLSFIV